MTDFRSRIRYVATVTQNGEPVIPKVYVTPMGLLEFKFTNQTVVRTLAATVGCLRFSIEQRDLAGHTLTTVVINARVDRIVEVELNMTGDPWVSEEFRVHLVEEEQRVV